MLGFTRRSVLAAIAAAPTAVTSAAADHDKARAAIASVINAPGTDLSDRPNEENDHAAWRVVDQLDTWTSNLGMSDPTFLPHHIRGKKSWSAAFKAHVNAHRQRELQWMREQIMRNEQVMQALVRVLKEGK